MARRHVLREHEARSSDRGSRRRRGATGAPARGTLKLAERDAETPRLDEERDPEHAVAPDRAARHRRLRARTGDGASPARSRTPRRPRKSIRARRRRAKSSARSRARTGSARPPGRTASTSCPRAGALGFAVSASECTASASVAVDRRRVRRPELAGRDGDVPGGERRR